MDNVFIGVFGAMAVLFAFLVVPGLLIAQPPSDEELTKACAKFGGVAQVVSSDTSFMRNAPSGVVCKNGKVVDLVN